MWIPQGDGPFPLLLTQPRFYQIFWAEDAVKRGYIACLYPGLDVHHQERDDPGYSLGGMVGLYATALDGRLAGVASLCGFTSLRTDTSDRTTGGNRRLYLWHALLPKLGLFEGREDSIPSDFEDVLPLIAPRPCLVYAPRRDRAATFADVTACLDRARPAWAGAGNSKNLTLLTPDDVNRFQSGQQQLFLDWLGDVARTRGSPGDGKKISSP
ncbi:MAG: hypothetical protein MUE50_10805 [Pirellulaceae bacterium]|nr:hypothetical protein [Pirellulaceae bacterium]